MQEISAAGNITKVTLPKPDKPGEKVVLTLQSKKFEWNGQRLQRFIKQHQLTHKQVADLIITSDRHVRNLLSDTTPIHRTIPFFLLNWEEQRNKEQRNART